MKLAEALLVRADQKKKLASLRERIGKNARVQEGEEPAEKINELIAEAFAVLKQQQMLVQSIERANIQAKLADGRVLAEALAERENMVQQHALLIAAIAATSLDSDRYSQREIKWVAQIKVSSVQKQADDISARIRHLNVLIQETNWGTEI